MSLISIDQQIAESLFANEYTTQDGKYYVDLNLIDNDADGIAETILGEDTLERDNFFSGKFLSIPYAIDKIIGNVLTLPFQGRLKVSFHIKNNIQFAILYSPEKIQITTQLPPLLNETEFESLINYDFNYFNLKIQDLITNQKTDGFSLREEYLRLDNENGFSSEEYDSKNCYIGFKYHLKNKMQTESYYENLLTELLNNSQPVRFTFRQNDKFIIEKYNNLGELEIITVQISNINLESSENQQYLISRILGGYDSNAQNQLLNYLSSEYAIIYPSQNTTSTNNVVITNEENYITDPTTNITDPTTNITDPTTSTTSTTNIDNSSPVYGDVEPAEDGIDNLETINGNTGTGVTEWDGVVPPPTNPESNSGTQIGDWSGSDYSGPSGPITSDTTNNNQNNNQQTSNTEIPGVLFRLHAGNRHKFFPYSINNNEQPWTHTGERVNIVATPKTKAWYVCWNIGIRSDGGTQLKMINTRNPKESEEPVLSFPKPKSLSSTNDITPYYVEQFENQQKWSVYLPGYSLPIFTIEPSQGCNVTYMTNSGWFHNESSTTEGVSNSGLILTRLPGVDIANDIELYVGCTAKNEDGSSLEIVYTRIILKANSTNSPDISVKWMPA